MGARLTLTAIKAGYQSNTILHGVDLQVPAGGSLTVIGPNGSGKSTLLKVVTGLVRPQSGRILLDDVDLTSHDAPTRAQAGVAYVPQEGNVFSNLAVLENLRVGWEFLHARGNRGNVTQWSEKLDEVLELFPEIRPFLATRAGLLSGGQRQMVAIAGAMMQHPRLLVLDEPSAGLSPKNAVALYAIVERIRQTGLTLLLIEQNIKLGLAAATTGLLLVAGQVRLTAPANELLTRQDLHQLYLGTA